MKRQPIRLIAVLAIAASTAWFPRSADASFVTGSVASTSGGTYNLTALGSLDWVHYGLLGGGDSSDGEPVRDSSGSIIGGLSSDVPIKAYSGGPNTYNWSNGSPVVSGSNTNGIYINDATGPNSPGVLSLTPRGIDDGAPGPILRQRDRGHPQSFTVALNDGSGASYTATNLISGYDIITIDYVASTASTLTMSFTSSDTQFRRGSQLLSVLML